MSKRPAKPARTPWLSPYLTVRDSDRTIAFYQKAFGFEVRMKMPMPDGRTGHVEMTYQDALIMFGPEGGFGGVCKAPVSLGAPSPVSLYVYCEDVDALHARAVAAGCTSDLPPTDMFWGDRMCKLTDPDGHVWIFATNVGDFDPSKLPH